jgi:hypothetical protein
MLLWAVGEKLIIQREDYRTRMKPRHDTDVQLELSSVMMLSVYAGNVSLLSSQHSHANAVIYLNALIYPLLLTSVQI